MNPKPNAEEFVRKTLFYICGIESQMIIMMHMMARQCEPDIKKADKIFEDWMAAARVQHKKLYEEALKEIGIPHSKGNDSEPT
jgi:hypothetical protein